MKKLLILFIAILFCSGPMAQSLTLQWTNSTSEGVTGYNLYRSETAGSGYADDITLTADGDYTVRILIDDGTNKKARWDLKAIAKYRR